MYNDFLKAKLVEKEDDLQKWIDTWKVLALKEKEKTNSLSQLQQERSLAVESSDKLKFTVCELQKELENLKEKFDKQQTVHDETTMKLKEDLKKAKQDLKLKEIEYEGLKKNFDSQVADIQSLQGTLIENLKKNKKGFGDRELPPKRKRIKITIQTPEKIPEVPKKSLSPKKRSPVKEILNEAESNNNNDGLGKAKSPIKENNKTKMSPSKSLTPKKNEAVNVLLDTEPDTEMSFKARMPYHLLQILSITPANVTKLAITKDGKYLASINIKGRINIWRLLKKAQFFCSHETGFVHSDHIIEFNSSGCYLLLTSCNKLIVYRFEKGRLNPQFETKNSSVSSNFWLDTENFYCGENKVLNKKCYSLVWLNNIHSEYRKLILSIQGFVQDLTICPLEKPDENGNDSFALFRLDKYDIGIIKFCRNHYQENDAEDYFKLSSLPHFVIKFSHIHSTTLTSDLRKMYVVIEKKNKKSQIVLIDLERFCREDTFVITENIICDFIYTWGHYVILKNADSGAPLVFNKNFTFNAQIPIDGLHTVLWNSYDPRMMFVGSKADINILVSNKN